jgi:hypothetical protein
VSQKRNYVFICHRGAVTHSVDLGLDYVDQQSLARELHPHVELPVEVFVFHELDGVSVAWSHNQLSVDCGRGL